MIRAYFKMLLDEAEMGVDDRNAAIRETAGKMKQFASWFTHGVPGGAGLRAAIYQAKTGTAVLEQVDAFFTAQPAAGPSAEGEPIESDAYPDGALVCD